MDRGYSSPGVEIFRSEEVILPNTTGQVIYGIVGVTTKGPYGYQEVTSIRKLHNMFGYAFLGYDEDGNRVISDAIIAAERVLTSARKIVFNRVRLSDTENAKFIRNTENTLNFTIANNDTTIKSIKAVSDGIRCTVYVEKIQVDGSSVQSEICNVGSEAELKKALEYDGTLIDVSVPEGYIKNIGPGPVKYTFESYPNQTADPSELYATGEVEVISATTLDTTVKVLSNVSPSGAVIPDFVGREFVVAGVNFIEDAIYELLDTEGTATGIWVKIKTQEPGEAPKDDIYAPCFNATDVVLTDEISVYGNKDAVNVQVLAAPMGSIIELGLTELQDKIQAYKKVNDEILKVVKTTKSDRDGGGRGDCIGLFDYPKDLKYFDAIRLFTSVVYRGIDEQQVAIAYPAVKVDSVYTPDVVELGSSSIWLDRMAYTDTNYYPWIAPAGYGNNRGVIPGVISINETLDKDKRDTLYENKINSVVKFTGKGTVLFGNRTLKTGTPYEDPSLFEKLNVVRLTNYIASVAYEVSLNVLFEPNDKTTWEQWTARMTTEMEKIKTNRGVEEYKVQMDEETVSDEDRLMGRAPAIIYILPIGAVEYIPIHLTLTNNRAIFGEEE